MTSVSTMGSPPKPAPVRGLSTDGLILVDDKFVKRNKKATQAQLYQNQNLLSQSVPNLAHTYQISAMAGRQHSGQPHNMLPNTKKPHGSGSLQGSVPPGSLHSIPRTNPEFPRTNSVENFQRTNQRTTLGDNFQRTTQVGTFQRTNSVDNFLRVSPESFHRTNSLDNFQRTNSMETFNRTNPESYHRAQGAYYFPNGEVFRPRTAPSQRNRPIKINTKVGPRSAPNLANSPANSPHLGAWNSPSMNQTSWNSPTANQGSFHSPQSSFNSPSMNRGSFHSPAMNQSSWNGPSMSPSLNSQPYIQHGSFGSSSHMKYQHNPAYSRTGLMTSLSSQNQMKAAKAVPHKKNAIPMSMSMSSLTRNENERNMSPINPISRNNPLPRSNPAPNNPLPRNNPIPNNTLPRNNPIPNNTLPRSNISSNHLNNIPTIITKNSPSAGQDVPDSYSYHKDKYLLSPSPSVSEVSEDSNSKSTHTPTTSINTDEKDRDANRESEGEHGHPESEKEIGSIDEKENESDEKEIGTVVNRIDEKEHGIDESAIDESENVENDRLAGPSGSAETLSKPIDLPIVLKVDEEEEEKHEEVNEKEHEKEHEKVHEKVPESIHEKTNESLGPVHHLVPHSIDTLGRPCPFGPRDPLDSPPKKRIVSMLPEPTIDVASIHSSPREHPPSGDSLRDRSQFDAYLRDRQQEVPPRGDLEIVNNLVVRKSRTSCPSTPLSESFNDALSQPPTPPPKPPAMNGFSRANSPRLGTSQLIATPPMISTPRIHSPVMAVPPRRAPPPPGSNLDVVKVSSAVHRPEEIPPVVVPYSATKRRGSGDVSSRASSRENFSSREDLTREKFSSREDLTREKFSSREDLSRENISSREDLRENFSSKLDSEKYAPDAEYKPSEGLQDSDAMLAVLTVLTSREYFVLAEDLGHSAIEAERLFSTPEKRSMLDVAEAHTIEPKESKINETQLRPNQFQSANTQSTEPPFSSTNTQSTESPKGPFPSNDTFESSIDAIESRGRAKLTKKEPAYSEPPTPQELRFNVSAYDLGAPESAPESPASESPRPGFNVTKRYDLFANLAGLGKLKKMFKKDENKKVKKSEEKFRSEEKIRSQEKMKIDEETEKPTKEDKRKKTEEKLGSFVRGRIFKRDKERSEPVELPAPLPTKSRPVSNDIAPVLARLPSFEAETGLFDEVMLEFDGITKHNEGTDVPRSRGDFFLKDDELSMAQIYDQRLKDKSSDDVTGEDKNNVKDGDMDKDEERDESEDRNEDSRNSPLHEGYPLAELPGEYRKVRPVSEEYMDDNLRFLQREFVWSSMDSLRESDDDFEEVCGAIVAEPETSDAPMVVTREQLERVFANLGPRQRRRLPGHLKYLGQLRDFEYVELTMKLFDDATAGAGHSAATGSIIKHGKSTGSRVSFSHKVQINETFAPETYKRYNKSVTQYTLTEPASINQIKNELNMFKCYEMMVHEQSKKNTHFFY